VLVENIHPPSDLWLERIGWRENPAGRPAISDDLFPGSNGDACHLVDGTMDGVIKEEEKEKKKRDSVILRFDCVLLVWYSLERR
jgi:hypothetical protein